MSASDDIQLVAPASAKLWREIHGALVKAGQALGPEDSPPFALVKRDAEGALAAALSGEIAFASLHVSHLFVAERFRGQGLGAHLLRTVETYGRARRCERVHLETRSEDALRFYKREGFTVFGELTRYAGPQSLYFLEKPI